MLLFEVMCKALWLALGAGPAAAAGDLSTELLELLFNCSLAVIVVAVIPWRHTWQRFATSTGDPWR